MFIEVGSLLYYHSPSAAVYSPFIMK